jgi:hypothetical protein
VSLAATYVEALKKFHISFNEVCAVLEIMLELLHALHTTAQTNIWYLLGRGMQWHSWLGYCTTNQKVAGLIPNGVIEIFHKYFPSGHTMALGLTLPLTK